MITLNNYNNIDIHDNKNFFNKIDESIFNKIVPHDMPTIHRRVEEVKLLAKIAKVCNSWRKSMFDPVHGRFKTLGKDIFKLVPVCPTDLKIFMGLLNQEIMKRSEGSEPLLDYCREPTKYKTCPKGANPNVLDFNGDSPYSLALSYILDPKKDSAVGDALLKELHSSGISDAALVSALSKVLTCGSFQDIENNFQKFIEVADSIVSSLKERGNVKLIQQYLDPKFIKTLLFKLPQWLEKRGVAYDDSDLLDAFLGLKKISCENEYVNSVRDEIRKNILSDPELKSLDPLIYFIDNACVLPLSLKTEFVEFINKRFPCNVDISQENHGKILNSISIEDNNIGTTFEKCRIEQERVRAEYDNKIINCLLNLKKSYQSTDSFVNWLLECNTEGVREENLLHQIALWRPSLITEMLKMNLISIEMCETRNSYGESVSEISKPRNMQYKSNQEDSDAINDALSYRNDRLHYYNNRAIIKPFIFDLFEHSYQFSEFKFSLLHKFLILLDSNVKDYAGNTLLHAFFESQFCNSKEMKMLLYFIDHGVDTKILNNEGQSALDIAKKHLHDWAYPYLR